MPVRLPEPRPARADFAGSPIGIAGTAELAGARAALQSGEQISGLINSFVEERIGRERAKSLTDLQSKLNSVREEALMTQDPNALDELLATKLPQVEEETLEAYPFRTPEYDQAVKGAVDRARASLSGHRMAVRRQDAFATVDRLERTFAEDVAQIPATDPDMQAEALEGLQSSLDGLASLSPGERERAFAGIARGGALAFAQQQIEADPESAADLFSGQRDAMIAADPLLKHLTPDDRAKLSKHAQVAFDASMEHERARAASDLELAVLDGRAGEKQINAAFEGKWITGEKRTSLIRASRKLAQEGATSLAVRDRFGAVMDGEDVYDPTNEKDRKQVDRVFAESVLPSLEKVPPEARPALLADVVGKVGVLPSVVKSRITGQLLNGSPEQVVAASDLLDRFAEKNPGLLRQVDPMAREKGVRVSQLVRAGVPAPEAVRRTDEAFRQSESEQKVRVAAYAEAQKANASWLTGQTTSVLRFDEPEIPDAMRGEFELLTREAYLRSGDIDSARTSALRDMQTVWAETSINGEPRWMKYAPERFYPVPDGDAEWMREQLVKDVNEKLGNLRPDGSPKGTGFLGRVALPGGDFATEFSIGVQIDGKETEIPTLVPTLTKAEVEKLTSDIIPNRKPIPDAIVNKAVAHARARIAAGESPFHDSEGIAAAAEGIRVEPDLVTAREAALGRPTYTVLVRDERGEFVPALTGWFPEYASSPAAARQAAETEEKVSRARRRRAAILRGDKDLLDDFVQAFQSLPRDARGGDMLQEHWLDPLANAGRTSFDTQAAVIEQLGQRGGIGPERFPTFRELTTVRRRGESDEAFRRRQEGR